MIITKSIDFLLACTINIVRFYLVIIIIMVCDSSGSLKIYNESGTNIIYSLSPYELCTSDTIGTILNLIPIDIRPSGLKATIGGNILEESNTLGNLGVDLTDVIFYSAPTTQTYNVKGTYKNGAFFTHNSFQDLGVISCDIPKVGDNISHIINYIKAGKIVLLKRAGATETSYCSSVDTNNTRLRCFGIYSMGFSSNKGYFTISVKIINTDSAGIVTSISSYPSKVICNHGTTKTEMQNIWTGTEAQYNAIGSKSSNTIYLCTES